MKTTTSELPHGLLDLEPIVEEAIPYTVDRVGARLTYLVLWPKAGLVKAGFASTRSRYRLWLNRGAKLIGLWVGGTPRSRTEKDLEVMLASLGTRAFASKSDVPARFVGLGGYTEFYQLDDEAVAALSAQIEETPLVLV